jgi:cbb3-type cytochrome oxidase maturation protein
MNSLVLLIPLSILILVGAGIALFWAIDHGQFDDMETAGLVPLFDADGQPPGTAPSDASVADSDDKARPLP